MNRIQLFKKRFIDRMPFFLSAPAFLWQILFFAVPLFVMVLFSFIARSSITSAFYITFSHYIQLFDYLHLRIIMHSLALATVVASLCLFVAYPTAYYLVFYACKLKQFFLFFLIVPFWTNLLILVYAWFFILERDGLVNTFLRWLGLISEPISLLHNLFAIVLVMFYCYLPFMIMPLVSALEKIDQSLVEASFDLGATSWQTVRQIIVPLSWPGIRTGFFLVYVLSFGEFAIPLLMGGDKYVFVGNGISYYVFNALQMEKGAAFTCISGLLLLATIVILDRLLRKVIYHR